MVAQIDLLWLHVCAAVSEVGTVGYLELVIKVVRNSHAPLCVACNVVWVAAQFRYMLGVSYKGHGCVQQCWECGQATWSS